jgi:hypothetical protein
MFERWSSASCVGWSMSDAVAEIGAASVARRRNRQVVAS